MAGLLASNYALQRCVHASERARVLRAGQYCAGSALIGQCALAERGC